MQILQKNIEQGKRKFVFLGEAGSGKSEIAINWALMLRAMGKPVRFFDMDQTKPVFRSREVAKLLQENQILMDEYHQFLDSPTVPSGVLDRIKESDVFTILDVGGNAGGARTMGQFAEAWGDGAIAYLVLNCYRPFSGKQQDLLVTLDNIVTAARVKNVGVICNPNFGEETTLEDVVTGYNELATILLRTKYHIDLLVVPQRFEDKVKTEFPNVDVFGITRYIKAPWEVNEELQEEDKHG